MRLTRRDAIRSVVIVTATVFATAGLVGLALAAPKLWECNRCHQQYQGDHPPPFVKCPSGDGKQTHWWIRK